MHFFDPRFSGREYSALSGEGMLAAGFAGREYFTPSGEGIPACGLAGREYFTPSGEGISTLFCVDIRDLALKGSARFRAPRG